MKRRHFLRFLPAGIFFLLLGASILAESSSVAADLALDSSESVEDATSTKPAEEVISAESTDEGTSTESVEEPEELLLNASEGARLHLYDGEETAILSSGGSRSLVTMADKSFTRRLYDQEYRLASRLTWQHLDGSEEEEGAAGQLMVPPQLAYQEDYYYYDRTSRRQRVVLTDFKERSRTESHFSSEGLLIREDFLQYIPVEEVADKENASENGAEETDSSESEGSGQKVQEAGDFPLDPWKDFPQLTLTLRTEYSYNEENALVEKVVTHFKKDGELRERTVYHQPGNIHGGYDFLSDDQLLVSRKYHDKSLYTETRYMDVMKIEAQYNGARLVSETIYLDGKELRRTEY